jgi:hypothetical protein
MHGLIIFLKGKTVGEAPTVEKPFYKNIGEFKRLTLKIS